MPEGSFRSSLATCHSPPQFEGKHIAHYENGEAYFMHANNVGTTAFVADCSGAVVQDELHYPWGEESTMKGTLTEERFAGVQR
jgi:hypothetical protein